MTMQLFSLYYATNRNHLGDRWQPTGYGQNFSADRANNLRFGKVSIALDPEKIHTFTDKKVAGHVGDGEGLAAYICEQLKKEHNIITFAEPKSDSLQPLASQNAFQEIKTTMAKKRDVMIYIHGFNVDWFEAVAAALALEIMLNNQRKSKGSKEIAIFLFTWPSNGKMLKEKAYLSDRHDAEDSALAVARGLLKLRDFLSSLSPNSSQKMHHPCNQELHLLCHSMGNYVLQHALQSLIKMNQHAHIPRIFEHIFMCAPDIDEDVFEAQQPMENLHKLARHISIYYNSGDLAMYISDFTKGNPDRLGHHGAARPQQLHHKISQVDCSDIVSGITEHSYYLWATVNNDIKQSILGISADNSQRRRTLLTMNSWRLY